MGVLWSHIWLNSFAIIDAKWLRNHWLQPLLGQIGFLRIFHRFRLRKPSTKRFVYKRFVQIPCPKRRCNIEDRKRVAQRRRFANSAWKSGTHAEGEFATQKHKKTSFPIISHFSFTKRYLFCFKHKLQMQSGQQVSKWIHFCASSTYTS